MRERLVYLPMDDGARIAATLYLPDNLWERRCPAILEVLPYRKDDLSAKSAHERYSWFAARGYIGCLADVRGTGASTGRPGGEYSERELRDTLRVIEWLSRLPDCNGNVGMWGGSYGGFNSIQAAMARPPALKAIAPMCASDDLYTDDVHYLGGCLHAFESVWAAGMEAENAFPAYPYYETDDASSRERFDAEPWILHALREQTDGPYWRRGSLRPRYGSIKVPVMMIGGWLDGYTDAVPRMLRSLRVPAKAVIGPWAHARPDSKGPWPRIHYLREVLRWWDRWLKGKRNGVTSEPALAAFIRESYAPSDTRLSGVTIPGRWRCEQGWPPSGAREREYFPGPGGALRAKPGARRACALPYLATVGTTGKTWAPNGDGSYGTDQRGDDASCLCFTTEPLKEPVEVLGFPRVRLRAASPADRMNWIARLNDVSPDGTSQLVSRGVLNAAHRRSHGRPEPLVPGEEYRLDLSLQATSWVFPAGHRIRLALSNGDWPLIWPSPFPGTNTVFVGGRGGARLTLPVLRPQRSGTRKPRFLPPEPSRGSRHYRSFGSPPTWDVRREGDSSTRLRSRDESGTELKREGLRLTRRRDIELKASDADPARARLEGWAELKVSGRGKSVSVRAEVSLRSDADAFHVGVRRSMLKRGRRVRRRQWRETIPRDLV